MKRKNARRAEDTSQGSTGVADQFVAAAEDFVHSAADRIGAAAERVGPLAQSAVDSVAPYAQQAKDRVTPYAAQAAGYIAPVAASIAPVAATARKRSADFAHDTAELIGPRLDDALERLGPAVDAARDKVYDDLLPRLSEAWAAAAASPVVVEAAKRGRATVAAARGELALPEPEPKKRGWLKAVAVVAVVGGATAYAVRRFLGSSDDGWQSARPTAPYAPPTPATPAPSTWADTAAPETSTTDGGADATLEESAVPVVAPDETTTAATAEYAESAERAEAAEAAEINEAITPTGSDAEPETSNLEGVYVGSEPPEGYTIKGDRNAMEYHLPDSADWTTTSGDVWFSSEEAAAAAGYSPARS